MDDNHTPEFSPEHVNPRKLDPLAVTSQDFEWNELERLLGEAETLTDEDREKLVHVFITIFQWAVESTPRKIDLQRIGLKLTALAWVISPRYFHSSPSARKLAQLAGVRKSKLSEACVAASKRFGLYNRPQRHGRGSKPKRKADVSRQVDAANDSHANN